MNKEKRIENMRTVIMLISFVIMLISIILQVVAFDLLRHVILCSIIILMIAGTMICDNLLKDGRGMSHRIGWLALWIANLAVNVILFI